MVPRMDLTCKLFSIKAVGKCKKKYSAAAGVFHNSVVGEQSEAVKSLALIDSLALALPTLIGLALSNAPKLEKYTLLFAEWSFVLRTGFGSLHLHLCLWYKLYNIGTGGDLLCRFARLRWQSDDQDVRAMLRAACS